MSGKRGPKRRTRLNRALLTLHKWAGLAAGAWLLVLGVSGILLDHDEWRWQRQMTVPEAWLSTRVARLLPATVMRYVAVDEARPDRWLGGSERGLWLTEDGGDSWSDVTFPGAQTPRCCASLARATAASKESSWPPTTGCGKQPKKAGTSSGTRWKAPASAA